MGRGLLVVPMLALAFAGCSLFDGGTEPDTASDGGLCGIDPAEWSAALAAAETSDPSASGGGDAGEAQSLAYDIAESDCLVGRSRGEVQGLLGGDGEVYFLGMEGLGVDTLSLELTYAGDRVSEVAVVQG
jgi:hypothetical protein